MEIHVCTVWVPGWEHWETSGPTCVTTVVAFNHEEGRNDVSIETPPAAAHPAVFAGSGCRPGWSLLRRTGQGAAAPHPRSRPSHVQHGRDGGQGARRGREGRHGRAPHGRGPAGRRLRQPARLRRRLGR